MSDIKIETLRGVRIDGKGVPKGATVSVDRGFAETLIGCGKAKKAVIKTPAKKADKK